MEDLGFLTGVALAPDGHSLILAKADLELLHVKPGDAPSVIWYVPKCCLLSGYRKRKSGLVVTLKFGVT